MATSPHGINYSAYRPVVMGRRGVVSSSHYLASQSGLRTLQAGGNAVDAAIAVASSLNVVEPEMSGIGGDGFMLVYMAKTGKVEALNGTGAAPLSASIDRFRDTGIPPKGQGPGTSVLRISTPGILDAWLEAHGRYGGLSLEKALGPAIELAAEGFPVSHRLANTLWGQREVLAAHPDTARTFLPNGRPPRAGELLANSGLARTLQRVAAEGREVFYGGEIGKAIVAACQSLGGLFTERDFAEHRCAGWGEPLVTTYRGVEVFEHPPNSPGLVLLEMLNMLETFDVASMDCNSSELIHLMVEIKKLAFADREYIADPAWVDVPTEGLLSKEYAASQAARINTERANLEVAKGEPVGAAHTTYFCVVDGEGNAVSHIQSLGGYFGSGIVAGDTGVLLNDRMTQWHLDPNHPNALMGGKRVRHTMNPPMAFKDGKLFMVWGTPGGDTQVQTNMQVLSHVMDFGMTVQEAVEAARWNHDQHGTHPSGYGGEFGDEDRLEIESRYPPDTLDALRAKGHKLIVETDWAAWDYWWGSAQAIMVDQETGTLMGAADPRGDGYAVSW